MKKTLLPTLKTHFVEQPTGWLVIASIILAIHPAQWLLATWLDPSYDTSGGWAALMVLLLWLRSVTSPRGIEVSQFQMLSQSGPTLRKDDPLTLILFAVATLIRLLSQLLAINILGAMALILDVYVLARWSGVATRLHALSPFWLAMAFAWSLPFAHLLERTGGYVLQWFSAQGVGTLLSIFGQKVLVQGTALTWMGQSIQVDPPCSGANSIVWAVLAWTLCCALYRPSAYKALQGALIALLGALLANIFRIALITLNTVWASHILVVGLPPTNLLEEPGHSMVGLISIALWILYPLSQWVRQLEWPDPHWMQLRGTLLYARLTQWRRRFSLLIPWMTLAHQRRLQARLGILVCLMALWLINLPASPMDVSHPVSPVTLPAFLGKTYGVAIPLSGQEQHYFARYGGRAAKVRYGKELVLVVKTASPLRHLHDPSDCLRGMGYQVIFQGRYNEGYPVSRYKAVSSDGKVWLVDVAFRSSRGQVVTSVSEALLLWFQQPGAEWMSVQRIRPETAQPNPELAHQLARVLDLRPLPEIVAPKSVLPAIQRREITLSQARGQDVLPKDLPIRQFKEEYNEP